MIITKERETWNEKDTLRYDMSVDMQSAHLDIIGAHHGKHINFDERNHDRFADTSS